MFAINTKVILHYYCMLIIYFEDTAVNGILTFAVCRKRES